MFFILDANKLNTPMGLLSNLLLKLKNGEVVFEYRKKDGRLRKARGSLNRDRIPPEDWNGVNNPKKVDENSARLKQFISYYDLDVGEWRRFKFLSLIRIVSFKTIQNINQMRQKYSDLDDEL